MPFLIADAFAQPLAHSGVVIESTGFDLTSYRPEFYTQLGVPLPQRVSKAVAKRQAEFLAGRHCAALALKALGSSDLNVKSGENRIPHWPQGFLGSISHTAGKAVAIAARQQDYSGLGIDCESLISDEVCERVYDTIAAPSDTQLLNTLLLNTGYWDKARFLTLVFSAKESLFKALYPTVGKYFGFDSARMLSVDANGFSIELTKTLNSRWQSGARFKGRYLVGNDYLLTLISVKA